MWNVTEKDGKTCYERCDGTRVFSTQAIESIENTERIQKEQSKETQINTPHPFEEYKPDEEGIIPSKYAPLIPVVVFLVFLLANLLS